MSRIYEMRCDCCGRLLTPVPGWTIVGKHGPRSGVDEVFDDRGIDSQERVQALEKIDLCPKCAGEVWGLIEARTRERGGIDARP